MASFDKHSNYNDKSSFSSVVFGADAPVLEVELNEVQQIIESKFSKLIKALLGGACLAPLSDESFIYNVSDKRVDIRECVAFTNRGKILYVDKGSITMSASNPYLYLVVTESTKSYSDTLKQYGNETSSTTVPNTMMDSRVSAETSRRKVLTYSFLASNKTLNDTENIEYVSIGVYDSANNTMIRKRGNIEELLLRTEDL